MASRHRVAVDFQRFRAAPTYIGKSFEKRFLPCVIGSRRGEEADLTFGIPIRLFTSVATRRLWKQSHDIDWNGSTEVNLDPLRCICLPRRSAFVSIRMHRFMLMGDAAETVREKAFSP